MVMYACNPGGMPMVSFMNPSEFDQVGALENAARTALTAALNGAAALQPTKPSDVKTSSPQASARANLKKWYYPAKAVRGVVSLR
jgi:hypothetical protein